MSLIVRNFLVLALLAFCQPSNAQNEDIVSKLASELSWDSFEYHTTTYFTEIVFIGTSAKELIEIGKPATEELLQIVEIEDKGVIVHLLLTRIWYPKKLKVKTDYVYGQGEEIQKIIYCVNSLKWSWSETDGSSVNKSDLKGIKEFWHKKLPKKYFSKN